MRLSQTRKGNAKKKGKWDKKRARPQGTSNKENVVPYKKFNAWNRGEGFRSKENNRDACWKPIECWTCGKDRRRQYFS